MLPIRLRNGHRIPLYFVDLLRLAESRDDAVERGADLVRIFRFQRGAEDLQLFFQLGGCDERLMLDIDLSFAVFSVLLPAMCSSS